VYAKQKKYIWQQIWKPKVLAIRNVYTRIYILCAP
jgi:hypothetical protein